MKADCREGILFWKYSGCGNDFIIFDNRNHWFPVNDIPYIQQLCDRKHGLVAGDPLDTDIVILAIGVRPEADLAKTAGLTLGARGGIRVDDRMQTSDPHIWAVGDVVEVRDIVTRPLAGRAPGRARKPPGAHCRCTILQALRPAACDPGCLPLWGVQGTAVCSVFGLTVAITGASKRPCSALAAPGMPKSICILAAMRATTPVPSRYI